MQNYKNVILECKVNINFLLLNYFSQFCIKSWFCRNK